MGRGWVLACGSFSSAPIAVCCSQTTAINYTCSGVRTMPSSHRCQHNACQLIRPEGARFKETTERMTNWLATSTWPVAGRNGLRRCSARATTHQRSGSHASCRRDRRAASRCPSPARSHAPARRSTRCAKGDRARRRCDRARRRCVRAARSVRFVPCPSRMTTSAVGRWRNSETISLASGGKRRVVADRFRRKLMGPAVAGAAMVSC